MEISLFVEEIGDHLGLVEASSSDGLASQDLDSIQMLEVAAWLNDHGVFPKVEELQCVRTLQDVHALYLRAAGDVPDGVSVRTESRPGAAGSESASEESLRLIPFPPEAARFLYELSVSDEVGFRWRFRGGVPSFADFERGLSQGVLIHFLAVAPAGEDSDRPIGYVVAYNPDLANGFTYAASLFVPEVMGTGIPAQANKIFFRRIFATWNIRKIYLEIPAFNFDLLRSGAGRLFEIEGTLREHDFWDGKFWDKYIVAIYRP